MSVIPFSAFTAQLTVSSFQPKFTLHSSFTLGSTSNGIFPASEAVTLKIGRDGQGAEQARHLPPPGDR